VAETNWKNAREWKRRRNEKTESRRKRQPAVALRNTCYFENLPNEIKERVVGYIPYTNALHLTQTCKSVFSDLSLTKASSPLTDRSSANRGGVYNGNPPRCIALILPKNAHVLHSVTFQCDWREGRVRRKGLLFIVFKGFPSDVGDTYEEILRTLTFEDGKVVSTSPFAKDRDTSLQMSFHPEPNKVYQLWCKVVLHEIFHCVSET
jgi:hypothetical protein